LGLEEEIGAGVGLGEEGGAGSRVREIRFD